MRSFVRVYEEYSDNSAFEHINPNIVRRVFIDSTDEDGTVHVAIVYGDKTDTVESYPFEDTKEAQRFIKRIGGVK